MNVREIPLLVFNQCVIGSIKSAESDTLHGQGEALIGRTVNGMWLRWEDKGTIKGYSTDTRIDVFMGDWSASRFYQLHSDSLGGITANSSYGAQCLYHDNCRIVSSNLTARLGPAFGEVTEFGPILDVLTDVFALANNLFALPSVEHEATCLTIRSEARKAADTIVLP